jgi:hypothetical protein
LDYDSVLGPANEFGGFFIGSFFSFFWGMDGRMEARAHISTILGIAAIESIY